MLESLPREGPHDAPQAALHPRSDGGARRESRRAGAPPDRPPGRRVQGPLRPRDRQARRASRDEGSGFPVHLLRNGVRERVLCCMQGAFSDRWLKVAEANGKAASALRVEWGRAITAEMVDRELAKGGYDAITVVHNETSTGVMNRLDEIAEVMRKYPDVLFLVDAVSSMAATRIPVDAWGIDVCLAGLQKAFALPAGLTVASVSARALAKAKTIPHRGYYFDFVDMMKYHERG